jgi:hypothetical protein
MATTTSPKRRNGGRPRVFDTAELKKQSAPSRRASQDAAYADRARAILDRTDQRYAWLYPETGVRAGVLAELGRILTRDGADACLSAAAELCSTSPKTTRAAVEQLRSQRLEGRVSGSLTAPASDQEAALDDDPEWRVDWDLHRRLFYGGLKPHLAEHPDAARSTIEATLVLFYQDLEELIAIAKHELDQERG